MPQWKMARPSRLALRFNVFAIRRGFPVIAFVAPRLPRWLVFAGARAVITVVFVVNRRTRPAVARNLGRVLGAPPESRRVRQASRQMLYNYAYSWSDHFRYALSPPERAQAQVDRVEGREHLDRALQAGRGALLVTGHIGNWELGTYLLDRLAGVGCSVVYVPDQYGDVEAFRSLLRRRAPEVEEIPVKPQEAFASLPVLRALRRNRVVALQGDRDWDDRGLEMDFLGAPARFPRGPFLLAMMTGAPLLPIFIAYTSGYRFAVEIGAPIRVETSGDREADVRRAMAEWVRVLAAAVERWPTQWFTFYDYWPAAAAVPALHGRRPEAAG